VNKIGFTNYQILKQSVAAFLAVTLLFISAFSQAEQEVKNSNSTEYFTSLDSNFSDSFQAIQPELRIINASKAKIFLPSVVEPLIDHYTAVVYPKANILPQVFGIQSHLVTILKFVICTNAP